MLKKIKRNASRLLSSGPNDRRLEAISKVFSKDVSTSYNKKSFFIAVEGVEDLLFFGLFFSLVKDLQKSENIIAELLQIRSINGAIGVDIKSKFNRSWPIAQISNNQWAHVYRNFTDRIAYRSQPLFWSFLRYRDRKQAQKLWLEMKAMERPEQLSFRGIQIGDLIIDSYLRFRPSPRFDINDFFVLVILQQAVRELRLAENYFIAKRPCMYLSTYSTYIEHGIPVRVAISLGIPVRVYGNLITFGKRLSSDDFYHTTNVGQYKLKFESLSPDQRYSAINLAEIHLNHRLSGQIDSATSYMKISAYALSEEPVPDVAGAVVIFLHDFYDSPHIYADLIFSDFWTWISFTIETLSEAKIPFWIKAHPNQIPLSSKALIELQRNFPEARFISSGVANTQLVNAGMLCGVTVYGTVAHELAYLGVPTISCARHPHSSFEFSRTAKTCNEYKQMLLSPGELPLDRDEMQKQALAFYYMHNISGEEENKELKAAFIKYWKKCEAFEVDPEGIADSLQKLRKLLGWKLHLDEIIRDIKDYGKSTY